MGAGLGTIGDSIIFHHNSVVHYNAMWPIFDVAMAEERQPGSLAIVHWWEQEVIRLGD